MGERENRGTPLFPVSFSNLRKSQKHERRELNRLNVYSFVKKKDMFILIFLIRSREILQLQNLQSNTI